MQPGGYSGYDKGLSVLEQYGLVSENTYRGRGALLCQTQQGLKMIRPYDGSAGRMEKVYELLEHLKEAGHTKVDQLLRNEEGRLVSTDKDGVSYIVKDWWDCRECDARSGNDVIKAVKMLAAMHQDMYMTVSRENETRDLQEVDHENQTQNVREADCENQAQDLREVYRRHNQELKKIREFIRKRKQKNRFEYMYLEHMPRYLTYGQETLKRLEESSYGWMRTVDFQKGTVCHNGCTQHNILMDKSGPILVNYEHYCLDSHMADLAQFMRKILEKHGWNCNLAEKMIYAYDSVRPLFQNEQEQLMIRLSYPEKFWKLSNYYYNNNKAFFPERNVEKLVQQMENEKNWLLFIKKLNWS